MAKQVINTEIFDPPNGEERRKILVVETDDDVRYIFESLYEEGVRRFSHRYYPNRPATERRDSSNYRLPESVQNRVENFIWDLEFMDCMIKEAQLNESSAVKFDNNGSVQSA